MVLMMMVLEYPVAVMVVMTAMVLMASLDEVAMVMVSFMVVGVVVIAVK